MFLTMGNGGFIPSTVRARFGLEGLGLSLRGCSWELGTKQPEPYQDPPKVLLNGVLMALNSGYLVQLEGTR